MDARVRMDDRHLELAAEFCRLVGVADLLAYLKLEADADADLARKKLKARRKYMQGMQGNPKYKQEALFLIKHFSALDAVLSDVQTYLQDANRRAESVHLPILEMTVRGVLASGSLTSDQEDYLRRNAIELGVSEETFEELLERITTELKVQRPSRAAPKEEPKEATPPPAPQSTGDFYRFLEVEPDAPREAIEAAWRRKRVSLDGMPPSPKRDELKVKLEIAWNVLQDTHARKQYDLSSTRTGPPARTRVARPDQAATAPPVRRQAGPPGATTTPDKAGRPARLEVDGDPVRLIRMAKDPVTETIVVRNIGDQPLQGKVTTDVVWLRAEPEQLDPNRAEQQVRVVIDPVLLPGDDASGQVRIVADPGGRATVDFQIRRSSPLPASWLAGGALVAVVVMLGLGWVLFNNAGPGSSGLTLRVDPAAFEVHLDGRVVGSGSEVHVAEPPLGPVTVSVSHPNFEPWSRELQIERGRAQELDVKLKLARPMDFVPTPQMTRGTVDEAVAAEVVGARRQAIEACIRKHARVGQILTGTIRVHVGPDGAARGFEVQGRHAEVPEVRACLERQAAAVTLPPLESGDYATVRYDYTVTAAETP